MCMYVTCRQELVEVRRGALDPMEFQMVVSLHEVQGSEPSYSTAAVVLLIIQPNPLSLSMYFLIFNAKCELFRLNVGLASQSYPKAKLCIPFDIVLRQKPNLQIVSGQTDTKTQTPWFIL